MDDKHIVAVTRFPRICPTRFLGWPIGPGTAGGPNPVAGTPDHSPRRSPNGAIGGNGHAPVEARMAVGLRRGAKPAMGRRVSVQPRRGPRDGPVFSHDPQRDGRAIGASSRLRARRHTQPSAEHPARPPRPGVGRDVCRRGGHRLGCGRGIDGARTRLDVWHGRVRRQEVRALGGAKHFGASSGRRLEHRPTQNAAHARRDRQQPVPARQREYPGRPDVPFATRHELPRCVASKATSATAPTSPCQRRGAGARVLQRQDGATSSSICKPWPCRRRCRLDALTYADENTFNLSRAIQPNHARSATTASRCCTTWALASVQAAGYCSPTGPTGTTNTCHDASLCP